MPTSLTLSVKYVCVQVPLPKEVVDALKVKSGKCTIKDALAEVVYHYLSCPYANLDSSNKNSKRNSSFRGRKPLYLKEIMTNHVPNKRRGEDLGR